MNRILLVSLAAVALVCGILFLLIDIVNHDDVEYAKRLLCKANQQRIYSKLKEYQLERQTLPLGLETLVREEYISREDIRCPTNVCDPNVRVYKYLPENLGDPNLPVISENKENHSSDKLRLKKLKPALIETMGDGKTVLRKVVP